MKISFKAIRRTILVLVSGAIAERVYNLLKKRSDLVISQVDHELLMKLPHTSYTVGGGATEPNNLVLVGREEDISRTFTNAGWQGAVATSVWTLLKAFLANLFSVPYPRGPFTPHFINGEAQALAFQKPGERNSFRERHHVRIWQTAYMMADGKPIWVASASFEPGIKFIPKPLFITHRIDADLDKERDLLVSELTEHGATQAGKFSLTNPKEAVTTYGDPFRTDGQVTVLEIS